MNVNFKILGIDFAGTNIYVKFWADGAIDSEFAQHLGPYTIYLDPSIETMTDLELKEWIAHWGLSIVKRQYDAIAARENGTIARLTAMMGAEYSADVNEPI